MTGCVDGLICVKARAALAAKIDEFVVAWLTNQQLEQRVNTAGALNNLMNRAGRS